MDVKMAFLNGEIDAEIYMEQPEGFVAPGQEKKVCKLIRSLYGLKQAPKQWHLKFDNTMLSNGYKINECDKCVYVKGTSEAFVIVCLYVDDLLIMGSSHDSIMDTKRMLKRNFDMKDMGTADVILGIKISRTHDGIILSQSHYVEKVLKKFNAFDISPSKTPIDLSVNLVANEAEPPVDQTRYRALIGSLVYLTASRPDITFAVGVCARFQSAPKESHMTTTMRILRYLKGCQEVGLWYPKECGFKLIGYSDSDYAGCRVDRKSTSGTCQMLGNRLVSWFSKKQNSIATSTAEAEYIATSQVLWMRQQLRDYDVEEKEIPIMCDNTSAIAITQNPVLHSRTKHIDVRYHFVRDHVEKKDITLEYISTDKQLADIFTKPLCESRFEELKHELGLIELS
ncbi:hypothetical protein DH2020_003642 [Rehmannia glutinosa]|uniref:Reverse transcriptase Ty1/copia-type domain-containing protein n=1 Tax=Rehmannia glutinosa TaxID=99300 RepID=A0ABR0XML6_REHGL